MDALDRAKQNRDHAEIDAAIQAARSPEEHAADAAIIARCHAEDVARHKELSRRLLNNGGRHYWGIMDGWKFEG